MRMLFTSLSEAVGLCGLNKTQFALVEHQLRSLVGKSIILLGTENREEFLSAYLAGLELDNVLAIICPASRKQSRFLADMPFDLALGFADNNQLGCHTEKLKANVKDQLFEKQIKIILPTSGSTSSPKLVCFTKDQIRFSAQSIAESLSLSPKSIALGYLDLSYTYGLSVLHSHLWARGRFFLPSSEASILSLLKSDASFTHLYLVPSILAYLKNVSTRIKWPASLEMVCQAGGAISENDSIFWQKYFGQFGIEFVKMYGQTECGPRISCARAGDIESEPQSVGKLLSGVQIEVSEETSEIMVESMAACSGFLKLAGEDAGFAERIGLVATGDEGYLTANGNLVIIGRMVRRAKIQDIRYGLDEVEAYIESELKKEIAVIAYNGKLILVPSSAIKVGQAKSLISKEFGIAQRNVEVGSSALFRQTHSGKKAYGEIEKLYLVSTGIR